MSARTWCKVGAIGLVAGARWCWRWPAGDGRGDGGHGFGRMGPANARTTAVDPGAVPTSRCRSSAGSSGRAPPASWHSPSAYAVDWNSPDDLGKPAVASAPGVVVKAVTLTDSYGKLRRHRPRRRLLHPLRPPEQHRHDGRHLPRPGRRGRARRRHRQRDRAAPALRGAQGRRLLPAVLPPHHVRLRRDPGLGQLRRPAGHRRLGRQRRGDVGVYRSTPTGSEFRLQKPTSTRAFVWGAPGDTPFIGDWNGDRTSPRSGGARSAPPRSPSGCGTRPRRRTASGRRPTPR